MTLSRPSCRVPISIFNLLRTACFPLNPWRPINGIGWADGGVIGLDFKRGPLLFRTTDPLLRSEGLQDAFGLMQVPLDPDGACFRCVRTEHCGTGTQCVPAELSASRTGRF